MPLFIEFFHDPLCAFCFVLSPRLKKLAEELPGLEIEHRSFALAPDPEEIARRFGSKAEGKEAILGHWRRAAGLESEPKINADLMEQMDHDYPYSIPPLLACKAAENQRGQAGHWDYLDLVQTAHLSDARDINNPEVLIDLAGQMGLDTKQFTEDMADDESLDLIQADLELAQMYRVHSVPSLVIERGEWVIEGAVEYADLKARITAMMEGQA